MSCHPCLISLQCPPSMSLTLLLFGLKAGWSARAPVEGIAQPGIAHADACRGPPAFSRQGCQHSIMRVTQRARRRCNTVTDASFMQARGTSDAGCYVVLTRRIPGKAHA